MNILIPAFLALTALPAAAQQLPADNPFSAPSALPYQLPDFGKIKTEHFIPAFEAGIAEQRREVAAIIRNQEAPTFDNTIVALERSGRLLARVSKVFFNLNSANTNDAMQKVATEMAPKLTAHQDSISMDAGLFVRIKTLYQTKDYLKLDAESSQLLDRYYKQFVRSGAMLSDSDKEKLKDINKELASLTTQFDQNLIKGAKAGAVLVEKEADLDGLSAELKSAAALAAKERGLTGWLITLQNTTIQPPLEQLKDRALREKIYRASIARNTGGEFDNTALVAKIVDLRRRQAKLLGYDSYAAYSLEDESAGNPAAVNRILGQLGPAALAKAKSEAAGLQKLIDRQAAAAKAKPFQLQPWDWAFYAQQVRKTDYELDDAEVKPYFEYERVLKDGVFYAANLLYGLTFKERPDLKGYRPDVKVYEVFDRDGSALGLLLRDDFKRDDKNGGAWMDSFVDQSGLFGLKPVVTQCLNIPKPAEGQPALLSFDEVTTMFHEFGHALHGLFSDVKYPALAGLNVPADFAEYPSQLNEMFTREPAVLAHFARHYKTGEPLPKELLAKIVASQTYGEGYGTLEYVEAASADQAWHQLSAPPVPQAAGVAAFEEAALKKAGLLYGPVPPRYHTPYFAHAFSGGYQAAYYAYIWSEVLARDTADWFHKHGGPDRANGDYFRAKVLSRGRTMEPGALFENFYGGQPDIGPLLEWRGLTLAKPAAGAAK